jgi:hypothetical protein
MCGICSTTGVNVNAIVDNQGNNLLSPNGGGYIGANNPSGGLVPQVTMASQVVVTGPPETGPRVTIVDTNNPSGWPAWITAINGKPVDNGNPGGTYQPTNGAGRLPDLVSNVAMGGLWAIGPIILLIFLNRRRS